MPTCDPGTVARRLWAWLVTKADRKRQGPLTPGQAPCFGVHLLHVDSLLGADLVSKEAAGGAGGLGSLGPWGGEDQAPETWGCLGVVGRGRTGPRWGTRPLSACVTTPNLSRYNLRGNQGPARTVGLTTHYWVKWGTGKVSWVLAMQLPGGCQGPVCREQELWTWAHVRAPQGLLCPLRRMTLPQAPPHHCHPRLSRGTGHGAPCAAAYLQGQPAAS